MFLPLLQAVCMLSSFFDSCVLIQSIPSLVLFSFLNPSLVAECKANSLTLPFLATLGDTQRDAFLLEDFNDNHCGESK